ncbi:MAG: hypothetical protein DSZ10_02880 [Sulfurovum sp.]|nr:MAG: hypothetical protein DSZ10_02880 [Sulfurovum sp.]
MKQLIAKKYKRFVIYVEIFLVLTSIVLVYNFIPINGGKTTFYLSTTEPQKIIAKLKEEGYAITPIDKYVLQLIHTPEKGWYTLDPDAYYGRFLFFEHMYKHKSRRLMDVVVFAGETKEELLHRLGNDMKLNKEKLHTRYLSKAKYEEGDILAGRYTVAREADENETIDYLFDQSTEKIAALQKELLRHEPTPQAWGKILKTASVIQKESNSVKEMPLISAVIHNRLRKKMRLQMDATLNYGPYSHTVVTPERIKEDQSLYNTYKHRGLPPAPLSTVTLEALKAAIKPAKENYLFFMLTPTGEHNFTASYKAHLSNIRKFRAYQKEQLKKKEREAAKEAEKRNSKALIAIASGDKKTKNNKGVSGTVSLFRTNPSLMKKIKIDGSKVSYVRSGLVPLQEHRSCK